MNRTATRDPVDVLTDLAAGWADATKRWWTSAWPETRTDAWPDAWPRARQRGHGCGCPDDCGCGDPCACCVPRADVVVHARAGERRVVAFALRNPRRREQQVTLEVGPWHLCGNQPVQVEARFDVDSPLTLAECEHRVVRLLVAAASGKDGDQHVSGDVEACASAYADVRFEGCARPQRVAVVVHPAACDAVDVPCDCGCC